MFKCPNHPEITEGIVCGGDTPYWRHTQDWEDSDLDAENIYFYMNLATGEYQRKVFSEVPFDLVEEDWQEMFSHADGGCCGEPQCPVCLEYLEDKP